LAGNERRQVMWASHQVRSRLEDESVSLSPDAQKMLDELLTYGARRLGGREDSFRTAALALVDKIAALVPSALERERRFAAGRALDTGDIHYLMLSICPLWPFC